MSNQNALAANGAHHVNSWPEILGHVSHRRIRESPPYVDGISMENMKPANELCDDCVIAKSTRNSRKYKKITATKPIERVFTELVGPIKVESMNHSKYFITLVDEYSGYSMVRFLKWKGQAADSLMEMILETEKLFNSKVDNLYLIRGKSVLQKWLNSRGIVHELTTAYSPESNGRAERLNRTLMDSAGTIMVMYNSDEYEALWAEAINTSNYLRKRLKTRSSSLKRTPYEKIFGQRPSVDKSMVFGCRAYVHIPKQRISGKFNERVRKVGL